MRNTVSGIKVRIQKFEERKEDLLLTANNLILVVRHNEPSIGINKTR